MTRQDKLVGQMAAVIGYHMDHHNTQPREIVLSLRDLLVETLKTLKLEDRKTVISALHSDLQRKCLTS